MNYRGQLIAAAEFSFFASERCYAGYKTFAQEFAKLSIGISATTKDLLKDIEPIRIMTRAESDAIQPIRWADLTSAEALGRFSSSIQFS